MALLVHDQGELFTTFDVVGQNSSLWIDGVYHVSVARKTFDAMPGAARGEAGLANERRFDAELADELAVWKLSLIHI